MIRKWPGEYGQVLHHKHKFIITAEVHLSATFGPNISDFIDLCLDWVSIVRD